MGLEPSLHFLWQENDAELSQVALSPYQIDWTIVSTKEIHYILLVKSLIEIGPEVDGRIAIFCVDILIILLQIEGNFYTPLRDLHSHIRYSVSDKKVLLIEGLEVSQDINVVILLGKKYWDAWRPLRNYSQS